MQRKKGSHCALFSTPLLPDFAFVVVVNQVTAHTAALWFNTCFSREVFGIERAFLQPLELWGGRRPGARTSLWVSLLRAEVTTVMWPWEEGAQSPESWALSTSYILYFCKSAVTQSTLRTTETGCLLAGTWSKRNWVYYKHFLLTLLVSRKCHHINFKVLIWMSMSHVWSFFLLNLLI